ncbi:hypothetical protein, partial [Paenibacillus sp. OV219]|uniref:hypothetical protein n=1 Tax=Paenibacillus sp. OV219 TaxID=1884377 RepID=UPI0008AEB001
ETDPSEIRAMNKREIAVTLDIDEKTAYRLLQALTFGDMQMFAEISRGNKRNERFYMINPSFISRGEYPDKALQVVFRCKVS